MINYASTPPPEELVIDGDSYAIDTDYRTWIAVSELLKHATAENSEKTWMELQQLIFKREIFCGIEEALNKITEFLAGYPSYENKSYAGSQSQEVLCSFVHDINFIILAIRNQSGIDISYKCPHFHWWLFLLEFKSLEKRHYISEVIGYRAYEGDDKRLKKLKSFYTLPQEYTAEQKAQAEELNSMFYDC